jgi:tetratricopeptide (TPR) repeat protein
MEEAIESFEKAVAADENFLPALSDAAALYAHVGREESALRHLKKIGTIDPGRADAFYNAACMYARLDQPEEAMAWLKQAIEKGYRRWEQIRTDPDLESIRDLEAFERLLQMEKQAP